MFCLFCLASQRARTVVSPLLSSEIDEARGSFAADGRACGRRFRLIAVCVIGRLASLEVKKKERPGKEKGREARADVSRRLRVLWGKLGPEIASMDKKLYRFFEDYTVLYRFC